MKTTSTTTEETTPELQQVEIWKCKQADCKAWIRKEFVTVALPDCPLCKSSMVRSYKHVPVIPKKNNKKFIVGKIRS